MKHWFKNLFCFALLLVLIKTKAQVTKTLNGTVRYESGMSKTTLTTAKGNVTVNLPGLSGKVLTGTVSAEPAGKTDKEKKRNLEDLLKMVLVLKGQKITLSEMPRTFDLSVQDGESSRTPLELLSEAGDKMAAVSLPPVLSAPTIIKTGKPKLTSPSNILILGDALNLYTDQEFTPGEKFRLIDAKGMEYILQPICLSSQQAVLILPAGVSPGESKITESDQPASDAGAAYINIINMELSSPNTNLRPGQLSEVLVKLYTGSATNTSLGRTEDFSIDLRNMNPDIVTMENGNLQRVFSANMSIDDLKGVYQVKKTITGKNTGAFSVSATLHEDYNTSTDPFLPQENALQTPEDFNDWANAIKNDLREYAAIQKNDEGGRAIKTNTQRAIDHFPVCNNTSELDESKSIAADLLRPLKVPMGAAISWLSSYVAAKAASKAIPADPASVISLADYEVLKNGIEFMKRVGQTDNDVKLINDCTRAQELIEKIQTGEAGVHLPELKSLLNSVLIVAGKKIAADQHITRKTGMNNLEEASRYLPSLAAPGNVHPYNDLIGMLDPLKKALLVLPGKEQEILSQFQGVSLGNGNYQIQAMSIMNRPVSITVSVLPTLFFDLHRYSQEYIDAVNARTRRDTSMGTLVYTFIDETFGTWTRVFKNAMCIQTQRPAVGTCDLQLIHRQDEHGVETIINTGKYKKPTIYASSQCKKGVNSCVEIFAITSKVSYYYDNECQQEISSDDVYGFKCKQ